MKKCKYCKSEIDKKAKICPHCQKSQANPILKGIRIFFGIIIVMIGIGMIFSGSDSQSTEENNENGNSCYATMEKFNKINNGMSYEEVVELMRCEGTLSTETGYEDQSMQMYHWYAKNKVSNIVITVMNGKVSGKSQVGLK